MKILNFTAIGILDSLLKKKKQQTIRPAFSQHPCGGEKPARFKVGDKIQLIFKISLAKTGTQKGSLNNNWKGGITEGQNRDYHSIGYRLWRDSVFKRDNYTCRNLLCLKKSDGKIKINAHHMLPYSKFPEYKKEIWNGVTLCEGCHKEIHKKKRIKEIHIDCGQAEITEVFKIEMGKEIDGYYLTLEGLPAKWWAKYSETQPIIKDIYSKDGFKSAEEMFAYFDKAYGLGEAKQFWVYRFKWQN